MCVYRGVTSAVTKSALVGNGGKFSLRLRKCFVSLMCDGREIFTECECCCEKILFQHACVKLASRFIYFLFESFGGAGPKDKSLVRTENFSSVKAWLGRL